MRLVINDVSAARPARTDSCPEVIDSNNDGIDCPTVQEVKKIFRIIRSTRPKRIANNRVELVPWIIETERVIRSLAVEINPVSVVMPRCLQVFDPDQMILLNEVVTRAKLVETQESVEWYWRAEFGSRPGFVYERIAYGKDLSGHWLDESTDLRRLHKCPKNIFYRAVKSLPRLLDRLEREMVRSVKAEHRQAAQAEPPPATTAPPSEDRTEPTATEPSDNQSPTQERAAMDTSESSSITATEMESIDETP